MNEVDWDFAYNEVLLFEERKKDKLTMEQDKKMQEEKARLEEELKSKYVTEN